MRKITQFIAHQGMAACTKCVKKAVIDHANNKGKRNWAGTEMNRHRDRDTTLSQALDYKDSNP
jgi:hypothetical protein